MGNPKRKLSRHRKGNRNANKYLRPPTLVPCPKCGYSRPPHVICPNCGSYKGRKVVEVKG
ncbi:MAG: 50S ribosomal protein L32 [Planctomycetota bacterium]